jgi:hypothetical protein
MIYRPEETLLGKWSAVAYTYEGQGRHRHRVRHIHREPTKSGRLFPVKYKTKEEAEIKCNELNGGGNEKHS